MCRSIKRLYYRDQPTSSDDEIAAAALQFVRKVSGTRNPSRINQAIYDETVREVSITLKHMLQKLK